MDPHSQSSTQEISSINVIKDLRVSTGAIQMFLCSHIGDKLPHQHPLVCFYKNVFLCSELLVIVFGSDSTGKEWHIYYKSAHGSAFLLREILFIRTAVGSTCWQLFSSISVIDGSGLAAWLDASLVVCCFALHIGIVYGLRLSMNVL